MNSVLLAVIAALVVSPLAFPAGASAAPARTGIYFPLFTPPGPVWDDMLAYRKEHPSLPWIAVVDPHHGPGQQFDPVYAQSIAKLQAENVTVLGYVSTLWGAREAGAIKDDIRDYCDWYKVDGIMLDEMVSNPGLEGHYSGLTRYARSLGMGMVIGNVGTNIAPSYIGTVDSIGTVEGDGAPPLSWLAGWHTSYDKGNFLYVTYSQGWTDRDYIAKSAKYVGSIYMTDDSMPFPYDTFPSYFDELVSTLDPQGQDGLRNLSVKAFDLLGNSIEASASVDTGNSQRTPLTQVAGRGSSHTVTALGNQTYIFDHWDDGSKSPSRTVTLDSSQVLRAYYRTPSTSGLHSSIVVNALTLHGGQLHMGSAISFGGAQVKSGFAPLAFAGQDGRTYAVTADKSFGKLVFDHWENGDISATRQVSLQGGNVYLTAYYRVADASPASVTVDAYTLDGTEVRGLWATISSQGGYTPFTRAAEAGSYAVAATDSGIHVFDHWQDGSTNRTRTVTTSSDITLTAYYRTPPATLQVGSADLSGNSLEGMRMTIAAMDGKAQSGYTNMSYTGSQGSAYTVSASDYHGMVFDHWQDGVTDRTRNVMLTAENTELTAHYKTVGVQKGLTPATFASPLGPPGLLTVRAESLDGRPLNMWSLANPENDGSYAVTVHNYRGYTFSHWEDGGTNATRMVPAGKSAMIAFFGD